MINIIAHVVLFFSFLSFSITSSDMIQPLQLLSNNLDELTQLIQSTHEGNLKKIEDLQSELNKVEQRLAIVDQELEDISKDKIKINEELTQSLTRFALARTVRDELLDSENKP